MNYRNILLLLICFHKGYCQINIYSDLGSFLMGRPRGGDKFIEKIFMRPNIGFEKTKNLKTTSLLVMYKRNHGFVIYHRIFDSNGIRVDFSRKKYFPNNQRIYLEGQLRFESITAKDATTRHRFSNMDLSSKNFQFGFKIGASGSNTKKVSGDLSIGIGLGLFKDKETMPYLKRVLLPSDRIELERQQKMLDDWNRKIYFLPIPYFQYRIHFNGSNYKSEKAFQIKK